MKEKFVLWAYVTLLLVAPVAGAAALRPPAGAETEEPDAIQMNKPIEFPHAGVRIALPGGFEPLMLTEEFQVMAATRAGGRRATQSLSLSAYPVEGKTTAKEVLDELLKPLKQDLSFRYLKVIKETKTRIAGIDGKARRLSYTHRGVKTVAVRACFIREVELPGAETKTIPAKLNAKAQVRPYGGSQDRPTASKLYVAYVLTMEVALKHEKTLLRTFDAVVQAMAMIDFRRPIEIPIDFKGPFLKEFSQGYIIRMPKGWVGGHNELGVFTEQADYLLGGIASPWVQVVSAVVPETMTDQDCGEKAIEYEAKLGVKIEVLSKGPIKLAGMDACQYVLRKSIPLPLAETQPATQEGKSPPASQPTQTRPAIRPAEMPPSASVIEVLRLLNVPAFEKGKARHYAIIVSCKDSSVKQAVEFMENLAKGFSLVPIPGEEPEEEEEY